MRVKELGEFDVPKFILLEQEYICHLANALARQ